MQKRRVTVVPVLESKWDRSAVRRILVAAGLGAMLGFQSWKLLEYGFAAPISLPGSAWIFLSHVVLGVSVAVTAGFSQWWRRGWMLGLIFSVPTALGMHALGSRWVPYGLAVVASGLVTGLLVAFLTDTLAPYEKTATSRRSLQLHRSSESPRPNSRESQMDAIRQRLAEEKVCLDGLDSERQRRGDSGLGRATEDRVIWRELLELELQAIDEKNQSHS